MAPSLNRHTQVRSYINSPGIPLCECEFKCFGLFLPSPHFIVKKVVVNAFYGQKKGIGDQCIEMP